MERDDGVGRRDRLALFTGRTGDRPRLAPEVVEEVAQSLPVPNWVCTPSLTPPPHEVGAEAHLVLVEEPDDQHDREAGEHHRHDVDRPLLLDERRVEHRQGRQAHQADERRSDQLPRVVPGIEPDWDTESAPMCTAASSTAGCSSPELPRALTASRPPAPEGAATVAKAGRFALPGHTMQRGDFGTVTAVLPTCELEPTSTSTPRHQIPWSHPQLARTAASSSVMAVVPTPPARRRMFPDPSAS